MAEKQGLLKEKCSLVILVFSLICFSLVIADLCTRFNDKRQPESGMVKAFATGQQSGVDNTESKVEFLPPEELNQLIDEQMRGEAGG